MGAMRRGEIQSDNKLWMTYGDLIIKMPRKNLVSVIEKEHAILTEQITKVRNEIKQKIKELIALQPAVLDMDPYVVKLLLQQQQIDTTAIEEDDEEDELEI